MTDPRTRTAAVSVSMALAMSLALAPAAMAQDGPDAPVKDMLAAIAEGRFADVTESICAEMEADALGGLGRLDELMASGMGYDLGLVFDALAIDTSGLEVSVVDEAAETATVSLAGSVEVGVDEDGLVTLLSVLLAEGDEPLDEELVRNAMLPMMQDQIDAMLGGTVDVDRGVQVVLEDGAWKVCDDLSELGDSLAGAMGAPAGSMLADEVMPADELMPADGDVPTDEPMPTDAGGDE